MCMYVHVYICKRTNAHTMEYYSSIKKKAILTFATAWVDLKGIILNEKIQTDKDKYIISLICGLLKIPDQTNKMIPSS